MSSTEDTFEHKRFTDPDEHVDFSHGHQDVVTIDDVRMLRVTFEPGFRWSQDVGTAERPRCPYEHRLHVLSGVLGIELPDGTELELNSGDVALLAPGHDSWTIGDEPVVFVDYVPTGE